ncbi:MAG: glycosyltransferase family 2 protein [Chitinophagaceae bacterium]|nr:glycosyltransferase family 2 protein [Chitinophagaceae bacterium]
MQQLSIVIIVKNEAHMLPQIIKAVQSVTDDIVICDTGSNDDTIAVAQSMGVKVVEEPWQGFGPTKNKANTYAKYDWILQLDADEIPDEQLKNALLQLPLNNNKEVFNMRFKAFLGDVWVRFGEWGRDEHIRLFNRTTVKWNDAPVHEQLQYDETFTITNLPGFILHKSMQNMQEFEQKMRAYGLQGGEKYFAQGKTGGWYKQYLSPALNFIINYFFKLGFLDGKAGWQVAKMNAWYTYLKYYTLVKLSRRK